MRVVMLQFQYAKEKPCTCYKPSECQQQPEAMLPHQVIHLLHLITRRVNTVQYGISRVLAHVTQLVGCCPTKQNVAGLIPSQVTCLGCGSSPLMFFSHIDVSFSLPSSLSLSKKEKGVLRDRDCIHITLIIVYYYNYPILLQLLLLISYFLLCLI